MCRPTQGWEVGCHAITSLTGAFDGSRFLIMSGHKPNLRQKWHDQPRVILHKFTSGSATAIRSHQQRAQECKTARPSTVQHDDHPLAMRAVIQDLLDMSADRLLCSKTGMLWPLQKSIDTWAGVVWPLKQCSAELKSQELGGRCGQMDTQHVARKWTLL